MQGLGSKLLFQRSDHIDKVKVVVLNRANGPALHRVCRRLGQLRVVDKTLQELQHEVEGLGGVLRSIEKRLENPAVARNRDAAGEEDGIWTSIEIATKDSERTVVALRGIVQDLTTAKSSSFFRKAVKQVRLNLDADEISAIRVRIRTHATSLQLALQMATMLVSSQSSNLVIDAIMPKLDIIIQDLISSQHPTTTNKLPTSFQNPDFLKHTKQLLSSASTVYGHNSTVWGGSEIGFPHASDAGPFIDGAKSSRIEDWIPLLGISEEESSQTSENHVRSLTSDTLVAEDGFDVGESESSDTDSDDDYDFAQKCFERAEKDFSMYRHAEAVNFFHAGLKRANKLGLEKKSRIELGTVQLGLALSLLDQGKLTESEELFRFLATSKTADEKSRRLALHASSGMAQICLCRRSYAEAEDWCKKNRVGVRRAVGTTHPLYITSLKLTAFLHELKGDLAATAVSEELAKEAQSQLNTGSSVVYLPGFTPEQTRRLVTKYHETSPETTPSSLERDEDASDLKALITATVKEIPRPRKLRVANLTRQDSNSAERPTYQTLPSDFGLMSQVETIITKEPDTSMTKQPSKAQGSTETLKLPHTSASNLGLDAYAKNTIVEESQDLAPKHTQSISSSIANRLREAFTRAALHQAARKGDMAALELLLKNGANIETKNSRGETALCLAVVAGHTAVINALLKHNALIETRTKDDCTPLLCARQNQTKSRVGAVRALLEAGADIEAMDNRGDTALCNAARLSRPDLVEVLLEFRPRLEAKNKLGQTPLILAVGFDGNYPKPLLKMIELLLAAGADVRAVDEKGRTALSLGCQTIALRTAFDEKYGPIYVQIIELLCSKGADPVGNPKHGPSPWSCTNQIKNEALRKAIRTVLKRYEAK